MKAQYGDVKKLIKSMLAVIGAMFLLWGALNITTANLFSPDILTDAVIKWIIGGFLLIIAKKF